MLVTSIDRGNEMIGMHEKWDRNESDLRKCLGLVDSMIDPHYTREILSEIDNNEFGLAFESLEHALGEAKVNIENIEGLKGTLSSLQNRIYG